MRIAAHYPSRADLDADIVSQLGHGGLLVRGEPPEGVAQFAPVELEIGYAGTTVVVAAEVLQLFPGIGLAVAIDPAGCARIQALATDATAPTARVEPDRSPPPPAGAAMLEKIQRALKGDREARFAVLRDPNRAIHVHVLRNPGLMLDEIAAIARMTTVATEVLKQIAGRREWGHRPEIAIALVRNPTTPVPLAIELLAHVNEVDLKQLAKDNRTREPVQRAARKRLLT